MTCFFSSYLVVLVLELLRLLGRIPGRGLAVIVMTSVGLFTHLTYLLIRIAATHTLSGGTGNEVGLLASWTDWLLMVAFGMAVCFLVFYLSRPDTVVSFFFLPAILATIALAWLVSGLAPFSRPEAVQTWRSVHGLAMVVGAGTMLVGFLVGVMYLIQSRRLKQKRAGSSLRLPTLETLGRLNRHCLIVSTCAVGVGVLAGVVMNLNRWGSVGWTERGVLLSGLLFAWLIACMILEFTYPPARRDRKVVYLTLASFGFLVLTMVGLLSSSHGQATDLSLRRASSPSQLFAEAPRR